MIIEFCFLFIAIMIEYNYWNDRKPPVYGLPILNDFDYLSRLKLYNYHLIILTNKNQLYILRAIIRI